MTEQTEREIKIDEYRLFLDLSSSCSGYVVARINRGKSLMLSDATCEIVRAGAIWFPPAWENSKKYHYMYRLVTEDFYVISAISDIVYERYSFNPKQQAGSLVVPEMIGAIKAATHDVCGLSLGIEEIAPQTWRSQCGIKPIIDPRSGAKDWKTATINHFDEFFEGKIPKKTLSNVTGKERTTPNDLYDAIGVCVGWHKKLGVEKFSIKDIAFNVGLSEVLD
jgi:hypothetical protein